MSSFYEIIGKMIKETDLKYNQALNIYESFFNSFSETEQLLQLYLEHQDFIAIKKLAHQIKGTAANLRIESVRSKAEDMEQAAHQESILSIANLITEIKNDIAQLNEQMSKNNKVKNLSILIVEDNLASGQMLEQIIINLGHTPLGIMTTPEQTLMFVKQQVPDLIFMDIDLSSEMNGIYTAELLSGYYSIPIVFVSIHADESTIMNATRFGVGYIVKPFMPREIEEMINRVKNNLTEVSPVEEIKKPKIKIKEDNKIILLDLEEVIYFESDLHMVIINTKNRNYKIRSNMKSLKKLDDDNLFITTHQSFLVNKRHIEQLVNNNYNYSLKLKEIDKLIPISKSNLKSVKQLFGS